MIANDGLKSGDKIPSERELCERLNVGRSSVREALRALELLGLIETRRGEGTYIRDFQGNQLVQLLSTFILQDEKAKKDVFETKNLIEMDCLRLAVQRMKKGNIEELMEWFNHSEHFLDDEFFIRLMELAENHLFFRIWSILKDYCYSMEEQRVEVKREDYMPILKALAERDETKAIAAYQKMRNLSFFSTKSNRF
ncbi:FadR family transcriptional regulator [Bacillus sp. BRMEA1]|uniref:FadR/GntR family transcriptional regulator n=1 Tax=Neobacillus endophyticus TaxID=2738405 RepID=UPI0015675328|nr:FadR family transcriptional regulator [Neobacillus endophyticus]